MAVRFITVFLMVISTDVRISTCKAESDYIERYKLDIGIACIVIASLLFTLLGLVAMICRYKKKYLMIREERLNYLGIIFDDRAERRAEMEALEMENKAKRVAGNMSFFFFCDILYTCIYYLA